MKILKQSTSAVIAFGPFVSPSDGATLVTTLVSAIDHASTGIFLSKAGGAGAVRHATVTASTYDSYGMYLVTLDATDTGTLGRLRVMFAAAASCLPVWDDFMVVPAMIYDSLVAGSDRFDVNVTHIADTSQTARDVGASVLLSSGTGAGQVKLSSGYVAPNWGDVGNPTTTVGLSGTTVKTATDVETDTQDIQGRLPAALGANGNIKADVRDFSGTAGTFASGRPEVNTTHWKGTAAATVDTAGYPVVTVKDGTGQGEIATTSGAVDTVTTLTNAPSDSSGVTTLLLRLSALRAGYLDNLSAGAVALEASLQALITTIGASAAGVATAVWGAATRLLTAGTNIVLAKGTGVTGFNDLSAAQVNAEADTAIADAALATAANLAIVAGYIDTEVAAIKAKTDNLPAAPAATSDIPTTAQIADKILGRNLAGGADGTRTVGDALRFLRNKVAISGLTLTVYAEDDSTPVWTATITRAAADALESVDPS